MSLLTPTWTPDELARWTGGAWQAPPAGDLHGVSSDTRRLSAGNFFVALRGDRFDGHDFVKQALDLGATAALVDRKSPALFETGLPLLVVEDTRKALTRMASGHRGSLNARLVGITGSVGKTSVKELLADALALDGPTFRSPGNWNNDLGLPLSLLRMLPDHQFGVLELGMNHPGEIAPLTRLLEPQVGVMTSIGPVHLEAFADETAIAREKSDLFKGLPPDGWAVVSQDSPHLELLRRAAPCRLVTTSTSADSGADYSVVRYGPGIFEVREGDHGEHRFFEAALPGGYFIENALLAIAAARRLGVSWGALQHTVCTYRPPPMRWERSHIEGVEIINDAYNANPLSMREVVRAFADTPVQRERWLVLGTMRELGPSAPALHRELGRELAAGGWAGVVLCGEGGAWIAEGAREGGMDAARIHACADAQTAAAVLGAGAQAGDAVLLKASRGEHLEHILAAWKTQDRDLLCTPCGAVGEAG